jgi:tRNA (cmo5U34)-methyltransferase
VQIPKNWTFKDNDVANSFDDHVREQLPWYDLVTEAVRHLILSYIPQGGRMLDIGASTGNLTSGFNDLAARNVCVAAYDDSPDMIVKYKGQGNIECADIVELANNNLIGEFDVCVLFLTVMFIPVSKRAKLMEHLMSKCRVGGCIIVVDKSTMKGGYLGTVLARMALKFKLSAGASPDEILKKDLSLSGVQMPTDFDQSSDYVKWFQIGEFSGYIYERGAV